VWQFGLDEACCGTIEDLKIKMEENRMVFDDCLFSMAALPEVRIACRAFLFFSDTACKCMNALLPDCFWFVFTSGDRVSNISSHHISIK
jgi:hypothetical protein